MKNANLKAILIALGCFLFTGVFLPAAASAQKTDEKPARRMMSITTVKVKPSMVSEFEKIIKEEYNPAFKKGGGMESEVWQMAMGDVFSFVFVQPVEKFAMMDGPSPVSKGLGAEAPAFFSRISKMVDGVNSVIIETRPEMSYSPPMNAPPKVAVVAYVRVDGSKAADFEKFIASDYMPAMKKADIMGYWASKTVFGGNANEYTFVTVEENFAELDKGHPLSRVMKPEERTQMFQKLPAGAVQNVEVYVARHRPELSVAGGAATTAKNK